MQAVLFHDFDLISSYYGKIPGGPYGSDHHSEVYRMLESDRDPLDEDFTDDVNRVCDTMLGYGDIDFFDTKQCKLLAGWPEARLMRPISPRLATIYRKLDEFARRAVAYGTGMVIEL